MHARRILILLGFGGVAAFPAHSAVWYVDGEVPVSGSGLSWAEAKKTFLEARNSTSPGDEIWMKRGRYAGRIALVGDVGVYGGFDGTETQRSQRDWVRNRTILDAEGANGSVVTFRGGATLDGFEITGANSTLFSGGGVNFSSTNGNGVLRNCRIYGNTAPSGGGITVESSEAVVEDCTITGNTANAAGGGGVNINGAPGSAPVLRRCVISANLSVGSSGNGGSGGGVLCTASSVTFEDCVVAGNKASLGGGVALSGTAAATFRRCVLSGNVNGQSAYGGGAIAAETATVPALFENCVISGNENGAVGAAAYLNTISPTFLNCTFSGNVTANAGAIFLAGGSSPVFTNCTFTGHGVWAIHEAGNDSAPVLTNCLFYGNQADFRDNGVTSVTGADALNALAGNSGNVSGHPWYAFQTDDRVSGLVQSKAFDTALRQTTITLTQPVLRPGALAGRMVTFVGNSQREALVYSNSASELVVADVDGTVQSADYTGGPNQVVLMDYHLTSGSAAVDRGTSAGAPLEDFDGNSRPVNIAGTGNEDPAGSFDIGAFEMRAGLPEFCGGGARITFPGSGRRIAGNRVLVRAGLDVSSCTALLNRITFEYRPAGATEWIALPGDANHPNPDVSRPFFVHWDVSGLADGAYDLRAVAMIDHVTDPAPGFVTVTIDSSSGSGQQRVNGAGETEALTEALPTTDTLLILGDVTGEVVAEIAIPEGALVAPTTLTGVIRNPAAFAGTHGAFAAPDAFLQLELADGQTEFAGGRSATLLFEYPDANDDGVVDGTSIPETLLQAHWLDGSSWRPLPVSTVDPEANTLQAATPHFSMFALFPGALPVTLTRFAVE